MKAYLANRKFISLQWMAALLISLVLIGVNTLVQSIYYRMQLDAQHAQSARRQSELQRSFLVTTKRSGLQLERLASQYAVYADTLRTAGGESMPAADLFAGIDALQFLSRNGQVIYAWQQEGGNFMPPADLTARAVREIGLYDRPRTYLDCNLSCQQHAYLPVLSPGGKEFIISVSRASSDVVLDFQQVTRADIALLTNMGSGLKPDPASLPSWRKRIALVTHADVMIPVIVKIAGKNALTNYINRTQGQDGSFYSISTFNLPSESVNSPIVVMVIEDESTAVTTLRRDAQLSVAVGMVGIVLVGIFLGFVLGPPLRRLRRLSGDLPMLAENRFDEIRDAINRQLTTKKSADEIDILQFETLELADRLERLQGVMTKQTEKLKEQLHTVELANRELEQFAFVASHDLQTPLRNVVLFAQLFKDKYGDKIGPESDEVIDYIVGGAQKMRDLVGGLLQYSQIGSNGIKKEWVELGSVLNEAKTKLDSGQKLHGAQVESDTLPKIHADAGLMALLIECLIDNAIKFQRGGMPYVHLAARQSEREWVIAVTDRGPGIAKQHQGRIFQIFQRLHSNEQYGGSGVGLTICEKIVRLHGGRIWIESELGKGSTFFFSIPKPLAKGEGINL